jgi:hypothetical protein
MLLNLKFQSICYCPAKNVDKTYPLGLGLDFSVWKYGINADSVVRVSMFWLIAAYLFHFG